MADIVYQNKDVVSKTFAEYFRDKSLKVYGLQVPKIIQVLPTNLPEIAANELRIDNLFLLADNSYAIIDYESDYDTGDKIKYLNYITRILERYKNEGKTDIRLRMLVIYTADVNRSSVKEQFDCGALVLQTETAFLSELDSEGIKKRLSEKIARHELLTEEDLMECIILPLTYPTRDAKQQSVQETVELAKEIADEHQQVFVLSGILVFSDKIINSETSEFIRRWISMTKVAQIFEREKQEALKENTEQLTAQVAKAMKLIKNGDNTVNALVAAGIAEGLARALLEE